MRMSKKVMTGVMAVALGFGAIGVWKISPQWTREGGLVQLTNNTSPFLPEAQFVNHSDPNKVIDVVLGLKVQNQKDLDALLDAQQNPNSPEFHKWLTPDQFAARFAPSDAQVNKVVSAVQAQGLTVVEVTPNHLLVHVRGKVGAIENMLHLNINEYSLANGVTGFANDRDPEISADLADVIDNVSGLDGFSVMQSHMRRANGPTKHDAAFGYGPKDVATAYNFPNSNNTANGVKYDGKGVTIAIATAYTYDPKDVQAFWKNYGITRTGTITDVEINGHTDQLDGETTLDLEQVGAQAPGADIRMYKASDPGFTGFALAFNQIVVDNKADVATVSWGLCEKGTGTAEMRTEHTLFEEAAAQGISFFAAAGDDGAYDCPAQMNMPRGMRTVDYPSSDPNVAAVGGTALQINSNGSIKNESAWTGAGGGVSNYYLQPKWQSGPGVVFNGLRNTSDVSLVADPQTAYSLFFQGAWDAAGGTSFASPNWAALTGLAVEGTGGRLGRIMPMVYQIGQSAQYNVVFHDITTGNNGNGKGKGFKATAGWDHPTGWGTPNGVELVQWLKDNHYASAPPASTTSTPAPTAPAAPSAPGKVDQVPPATQTEPSPTVKSQMAPFNPFR